MNWYRGNSSVLSQFFEIKPDFDFTFQRPKMGVGATCDHELQATSDGGCDAFPGGLSRAD